MLIISITLNSFISMRDEYQGLLPPVQQGGRINF